MLEAANVSDAVEMESAEEVLTRAERAVANLRAVADEMRASLTPDDVEADSLPLYREIAPDSHTFLDAEIAEPDNHHVHNSDPFYRRLLDDPSSEYQSAAARSIQSPSSPPDYHVLIGSDYTVRRGQLQTSWGVWSEQKRIEYRLNYLAWRESRQLAKQTFLSERAREPSSASLPSLDKQGGQRAEFVVPTAGDPNLSAPNTTDSQDKDGRRKVLKRVGRRITHAMMYSKMASWAAKTRQWKKERRACTEELDRERRAHYLCSAKSLEAEFAAKMNINGSGDANAEHTPMSHPPEPFTGDGKKDTQQSGQEKLLGVRLSDFPMPPLGSRPKTHGRAELRAPF